MLNDSWEMVAKGRTAASAAVGSASDPVLRSVLVGVSKVRSREGSECGGWDSCRLTKQWEAEPIKGLHQVQKRWESGWREESTRAAEGGQEPGKWTSRTDTGVWTLEVSPLALVSQKLPRSVVK